MQASFDLTGNMLTEVCFFFLQKKIKTMLTFEVGLCEGTGVFKGFVQTQQSHTTTGAATPMI